MIPPLFDLLSLLYVFAGARSIWTAWQKRKGLTDAELTGFDRRMLDQLAFFLLIPIGVFLHELGHALATIQLGGTVDWLGGGFHYALFWGYVEPIGRFSLLGFWWIALSGNLVSIAYGLLALPLLRLARANWQKYFWLSFARTQLGWALVGYPLITLLGFEGDWKTIHNPSTWIVGLPFGIFHLLLVLALFLWNRSASVQHWEVSLYAGVAEQLDALNRTLAARPNNREALIERGHLFLQHRMTSLALADFRQVLRQNPGDPSALASIAEIELDQKKILEAERHFREALPHSQQNPRMAGWIHFRLATILYEKGQREAAVTEYDQAILCNAAEPEFYHWRGLARRSIGQDDRARADFQNAVTLLDPTDPRRTEWAHELEQRTLER